MKNHLKADDRLSILRELDKFRSWESLDDKRFCILCEKVFRGRQIEITVSKDGTAVPHCPTRGCKSKIHHWVYPGNPLISETVFEDWCRAFVELNEAAPVPVSGKNMKGYRV